MAVDLKDLVAASGNKYADIVADGIVGSDVTGYIDSGSYALNALLCGSIYGGYPNNKITVLAGPSACGKTYFALFCVKDFLDKNPTGMVLYYDTENAITKEICTSRGIDVSRMAVMGISTVEEFKTQTARILEAYISKNNREPVLIVLDSLGMLSTNKEMQDTVDGKDVKDMTRAQLVKAAFRVLTLKAGRAGVPILVTNHTYNTQEMYSQQVMGGGTGTQYAGSSIVFLNKRKHKDGDERVGNLVRCRMVKSRLTVEDSELSVCIDFKKGLDRHYGLVEIALEGGVFEKVGTKIKLPDGTSVFEKRINNNPEKYFTTEILDQIDQAARKLFEYGSRDDVVINEDTDGDD